MTRIAALVCLLVAGCTTPVPDGYGQERWRSDTRQQVSTTTPGVHLSGHANIGIKHGF
ncbi:hypothetical protein [Sulfitobacter aestuariivivens]|uniref:Lipoprotein n=1 Tax=Sulfitobacter aestuariivivens TaxID=2766981 RepID=A0A927D4D3_9RHOB|nr:hypothetical protein [Sulfitobacter aestuariivivens]MBD3664033.1 hypothetical protein [Sulfitobacter aestuariivivens]